MSTARNHVTLPKFGILALALIAIALVALALVSPGRASAAHGPVDLVALGFRNGINIDASGSNCSLFGTWDSSSKTYTLTHDVIGHIGIMADGITLEGDGHTITGGGFSAVNVGNLTRSTIQDVTLNNINIVGAPIKGGSTARIGRISQYRTTLLPMYPVLVWQTASILLPTPVPKPLAQPAILFPGTL